MAENTTHEINFSDSDYIKAAEEWRSEILMMPILACEETLREVTMVPGVRGKYHHGSAQSNAQFAPFNPFRQSENSTDIKFRTLETFLGDIQEDFVPDMYIKTILGKGADFFGEGQKEAPSAKLVLQAVARSAGEKLHSCLFTAKRSDTGTTSAELFNGWGTIADDEITAGNIAEKHNNLLNVDDVIDATNVGDVLKAVERGADPVLRSMKKNLYCAPEVLDAYNDWYLLNHGNTPYNSQFDQTLLEGSNGRTRIVALPSLAGTDKMYLTPKGNMLFGCDTMGDIERVEVLRIRAFVLQLAMAMFFGTDFDSIDGRVLRVCKYSLEKETKPATPPATGGSGNNDSQTEQG